MSWQALPCSLVLPVVTRDYSLFGSAPAGDVPWLVLDLFLIRSELIPTRKGGGLCSIKSWLNSLTPAPV